MQEHHADFSNVDTPLGKGYHLRLSNREQVLEPVQEWDDTRRPTQIKDAVPKQYRPTHVTGGVAQQRPTHAPVWARELTHPDEAESEELLDSTGKQLNMSQAGRGSARPVDASTNFEKSGRGQSVASTAKFWKSSREPFDDDDDYPLFFDDVDAHAALNDKETRTTKQASVVRPPSLQ